MPAVAGKVAFTLNARRLTLSAARYIDSQTAKVKQQVAEIKERREKARQQQIAGGRAEARAWNQRRLEAEARGEPFNEPFPGDEP